MPFKASNNREAVVACARHVVKRPSKRSVLVTNKSNNMHHTFTISKNVFPITLQVDFWLDGSTR